MSTPTATSTRANGLTAGVYACVRERITHTHAHTHTVCAQTTGESKGGGGVEGEKNMGGEASRGAVLGREQAGTRPTDSGISFRAHHLTPPPFPDAARAARITASRGRAC